MTEHEWLTSTDPAEMLRWVMGGPWQRPDASPSDRKLRLFVAAGMRVVLPESKLPPDVEAMADDPSIPHNPMWWATDRDVLGAARCVVTASHREGRLESLSNLLRDICGNPYKPPPAIVRKPKQVCPRCRKGDRLWLRKREGDSWHCTHCRLNCHPVLLEATSWLTPTVVSLAEAAYQERGNSCPVSYHHLPHDYCDGTPSEKRRYNGTLDPVRLMVLADALEEAGCGNEDILMHLRGMEKRPKKFCFTCGCRVWTPGRKQGGVRMTWCAGCGANGPYEADALETEWHPSRSPHVRGCWAVDLLLGKE